MQRIFTRRKLLLIATLFINVVQKAQCDISVSTNDLTIQLEHTDSFNLILRNVTNYAPFTIKFDIQHKDIIRVEPDSYNVTKDEDVNIIVHAIGAGHSEVVANATNSSITVRKAFVRVTVQKHPELDTFSLVIGWIYFVAWSISFYPQIYVNFQRKSVVGLNFDFLALNIIGFTLYAVFNLGLYFIPEIKAEYSNRYPRGLNPVQVNDIVFAVHAAAATIITIVQCYLYERSDQRVSHVARIIIGVFGLFLFIGIILAASDVIHWLDFLYYCSYVKLTITLIKYVPQAYMNYKRQSTVGWSIGNIFLDFTGGILSMLQMIIISYNYDDWVSIFGDPTKFGLGLFSVVFDIFFIVQHYVLYRHTNYEEQ
ncbi:cystinosin homolog [Tribolium castaneum]|uniref:Cystinosin n=1 Tax=Tribolium castaneum TaxID=7070 RepID=D6X2V5_TRICA|nr:PREDICTED: cystinosin homolog [Tribolium castaneum]EFA10650.1 Cystinosin homolog-like Protein [Tribolium castaneum]|eukprot:XP_008199684.1 PREDICTED: cystinosin homolog [Tribolium castaneum]